ncbi:SET and MYND domain-containing protein 4-like [Bradysia coprophila]|uniref:SET and MYND domain-containing protein 4-like n=1 Tax=Bradysia coprophila TaxID=38358 RepID=UPI00187D8A58|nr:SET and MYND domain-containing protein 4-like [Bradysia coprophila]
MDSSSDVNFFLDPNFALSLYCKFGKISGIVPKIKLIVEEFRRKSETEESRPLTLKSNSKSNELRENALSILRSKDTFALQRALELYNESLCYAEQGSDEHLATLYASRASVYFDLREFELCVENIKLAEEKGYTEEGRLQLNKLKIDCLCLLQKYSNNQENGGENDAKIQLNVEPHAEIPFAASCLELKTDPIGGRYITTNKDIESGSIIIVECPFEKVLSSDCIYQRCSNCLERNSLHLIPCRNCTKTMFCSEKCSLEAFENFHRFECPIIDCLMDVGGQITIRTFLKAVQSFKTISQLIEFIQSADSSNRTAFSFNHSEALSPQQHYHQIHSLSTNLEIRPESDLFTHVLVAALFYYQLNYQSPFKSLVNGECEDILMELMFRIELITTINVFSFNDLSQDDEIVGTGLYQLSSLINHSCSPNACPKYYKSNLILYTTQPVMCGEAISISYQ